MIPITRRQVIIQINLPIVCPAALAIVAWVRWVNWSVHAEFVAATQGNPLQPALSGHGKWLKNKYPNTDR